MVQYQVKHRARLAALIPTFLQRLEEAVRIDEENDGPEQVLHGGPGREAAAGGGIEVQQILKEFTSLVLLSVIIDFDWQ
eukprot:2584762-Pleurochrysis_carterae.AAC.1